MTLLELAERCEAAKGPDAYTDLDIHKAVYPAEAHLFSLTDAPNYTGSLDAAMTLVPEGWRAGFEENARCDEPGKSYAWVWPFESSYDPDWQCGQEGQQSNPDSQKGYAATPALALCAAALKARAS